MKNFLIWFRDNILKSRTMWVAVALTTIATIFLSGHFSETLFGIWCGFEAGVFGFAVGSNKIGDFINSKIKQLDDSGK